MYDIVDFYLFIISSFNPHAQQKLAPEGLPIHMLSSGSVLGNIVILGELFRQSQSVQCLNSHCRKKHAIRRIALAI